MTPTRSQLPFWAWCVVIVDGEIRFEIRGVRVTREMIQCGGDDREDGNRTEIGGGRRPPRGRGRQAKRCDSLLRSHRHKSSKAKKQTKKGEGARVAAISIQNVPVSVENYCHPHQLFARNLLSQ